MHHTPRVHFLSSTLYPPSSHRRPDQARTHCVRQLCHCSHHTHRAVTPCRPQVSTLPMRMLHTPSSCAILHRPRVDTPHVSLFRTPRDLMCHLYSRTSTPCMWPFPIPNDHTHHLSTLRRRQVGTHCRHWARFLGKCLLQINNLCRRQASTPHMGLSRALSNHTRPIRILCICTRPTYVPKAPLPSILHRLEHTLNGHT